jgi:hypothetical protein
LTWDLRCRLFLVSYPQLCSGLLSKPRFSSSRSALGSRIPVSLCGVGMAVIAV